MVINQLTKWDYPPSSQCKHMLQLPTLGLILASRYLSSDHFTPIGCFILGMKYYPTIVGLFYKPWNKDHPVMNQPGFNDSCHVDGINLDVAHLKDKSIRILESVSDRTRSEQRVTIRLKSTKWWFFQRNETSEFDRRDIFVSGQIIATSAEVNTKWWFRFGNPPKMLLIQVWVVSQIHAEKYPVMAKTTRKLVPQNSWL